MTMTSLLAARTTSADVRNLCDGDYADYINPTYYSLAARYPISDDRAKHDRLFAIAIYLRVRQIRAIFRNLGR